MSSKLTRIRVPGRPRGDGLMDWGEKSAAEMIAFYRAYAAHLRERVEAIESAADDDFQIDVVRGSAVQHHVRTIQPGKAAAA